MHWLYLLIAGFLEVFWAIGLKFSNGFTQLIPSILTVLGMIFSFYFLSLALKNLPIGTAYAIWTGIGTIGTLIFGIIFFKERNIKQKLIGTILMIAGAIIILIN